MLNAGTSGFIRKEKPTEIFNITFAILPSYQKKILMVILSTLKSATLDETIRCASKYFILTLKNAKLELVNLKCLTYAQPIPLPLSVHNWVLFAHIDHRVLLH